MTRRLPQPGALRRPRGGFTLIELLVVVAIISLLVSILTPSLSRARQQAKGTVCLTRLKEFMNCLVMYSSDNDHLLPPAMYPIGAGTDALRHGWAEVLYEYLYQGRDYSFEQDYPVQRNHEGRFELWVCKEGIPQAGSTGHYRVYDVAWACGALDKVGPRLPLIADANPQVSDPEDLRRSDIPREHIAGLEGEAYIDERHYGGANYAFNDGHAVRDTRLKEKLAQDWDLNPATPNQ